MAGPDALTLLRSEHQRLAAMLELPGVPEPVRALLTIEKHVVAAKIVARAAEEGAHIELRVDATPTAAPTADVVPEPQPEPTAVEAPEPQPEAAAVQPEPPLREPQRNSRRRLSAPLRPPPREDFGEFVTGAHPEEEKMLREIVQRAKVNPRGGTVQKTLMHGTNDQNGYTVEGARLVTIDLRARTLTLAEVWGGLTTARRTRPLDGI